MIDYPPDLGDTTNPFLADKENQSTPASNEVTAQQKNLASTTTASARTLVKAPSELVDKLRTPSSSPSIFLCPSNSAVRGAIAFKPVPSSVLQPKQQSEFVPPLPINSRAYDDPQAYTK